ncbi:MULTISPECIES: P pilus assembly/Cpx signaling pathway, periplasmic inhibitor/zinc-resistance associated protein [unclassified Nostoc]|uniref:Spy/CpxP family protein refolding chaperone n=1 Tax=unclassified Nostoc TaxID=2593658 RepID=UPI002AD42A95|nr:MULTISPECIES: P pilus assembly/Cpx signaling pathway, periplasmic inhibitor/zinc-resistance associated protein [unclassified Nostoc]MDZ8124911.1 P pilus assembly/Cpx signaling pathway, periplasmic inhibitor/zinc-resistance associated protein [Nostoc sp. CmiVER01]MDZ8223907.1 P pilus assembly/Cpx signaling pathway, periplasmic inhibitor/zinc-resistance associated protein [Nostoc sp. ChiVER01]
MKLKALSLVAGAIALTLSATSFAVNAQTASPSPVLLAQTPQKERGPWKELGLTDTQKTQIQAIRRDSRTKMEAVFTPEQKAKLDAAKQARRAEWQARKAQGQTGQRQPGQRRGKGGYADLNLSEVQKTQLRQIRESEKQQIQAVLTAEQRQKLEQFRQNAPSRRQQGNPQ